MNRYFEDFLFFFFPSEEIFEYFKLTFTVKDSQKHSLMLIIRYITILTTSSLLKMKYLEKMKDK